ncbi:uncharacterized protein [Hetaerina americana]|uniref:uncharacterized protein isoform X2 n=1 Tax=Hetaerina americana TaxID=62018 RepID=UPI003A7F4173
MIGTLEIVAIFVTVFLASGSCSSEEKFWPCGHQVSTTHSLNLTEVLGEWLIIATIDDLSHKNELLKCDDVTFYEINGTHLLMSGNSQFQQENVTVEIRNTSDPWKWEIPEIDGGAVVVDLDPENFMTMAVCYRPLRFWWLAVLTRRPIAVGRNDTVVTSPLQVESSPPRPGNSNPRVLEDVLLRAAERLKKFDVDLEEASVLARGDC